MLIATVIAAGRLDDRLLGKAIEKVPGARLSAWIDEGDAADLLCEGDARAIRSALESLSGVDVAVREGPRRRAKLFVADMDSTMIGQECIDELADYAGVKTEVADVTERAMRGELDFKQALAERVALLKGLSAGTIDACRQARIRPNPGAATLVATLNAHGVTTALVSGGFTHFVDPIGAALGFQRTRANALGFEGDALDGRTVGEVVDGAAKQAFAEELLHSVGAERSALVAIGDGANDAGMVSIAGLGIGYRAKPALDERANAAIRHHDLSAALWMMGIPKAGWVICPEPESTPAA